MPHSDIDEATGQLWHPEAPDIEPGIRGASGELRNEDFAPRVPASLLKDVGVDVGKVVVTSIAEGAALAADSMVAFAVELLVADLIVGLPHVEAPCPWRAEHVDAEPPP